MFQSLEEIRQYCIGGMSPIAEFDESDPFMRGYRRALENVKNYVELRQERLVKDAMASLDAQKVGG